MGFFRKMNGFVALCLLISLCVVFSCGKEPKTGKLEITETSFSMEKDGKYSQSLNVTGKIRNVGPYDVKHVVVTGRCNSCSEIMVSGKWFATQTVKSEDQKDIIDYIPSGVEESFSFEDIAYYYNTDAVDPDSYPEGLEVYVESFETVPD